MTKRMLAMFWILMVSSRWVVGQTAKDIGTEYGPKELVYSVSEHLWMTPTFGSDGQLCLMRVYPKRVSSNTNYLQDNVDIDEALKFLEQAMPIQSRGNRKEFFGMSDISGHIIYTKFLYDRVGFVFISSFDMTKNPKGEGGVILETFDLSVDEAAMNDDRQREALKSDDQLIREHALKPQVLEIYWPNRQCLNP